MTKVEELRQLARVIKNEKAVGGNTAERVGNAFEGVADAIEGIDQINEMEKAVDAVKEKLNASKQAIEEAVNSLPIAQEVGDSVTKVMSQKAVTEVISPLEEKTPIDTTDDGFYVSDKFGNIVIKFDSNGFDVAKISAHFLSLLASLINTPIFETKESGFYVTDANLNIGFQVNSEHSNYLQFK